MTRDKQIGLKFETSDVERWDEWAGEHGYTRTTMIETAMERLMTATGEAPPPKGEESQAQEKSAPPRPRPGIRRAYVCKKEECNRRTFVPKEMPADFIPDCPEHGCMERQENKPYFGQSTK